MRVDDPTAYHPNEMMDTPIGTKRSVLAFAVALIGTAMAGFAQSAGAFVKSAIKVTNWNAGRSGLNQECTLQHLSLWDGALELYAFE
jgi:hypothetical protein